MKKAQRCYFHLAENTLNVPIKKDISILSPAQVKLQGKVLKEQSIMLSVQKKKGIRRQIQFQSEGWLER